jgi:hypothetical protein
MSMAMAYACGKGRWRAWEEAMRAMLRPDFKAKLARAYHCPEVQGLAPDEERLVAENLSEEEER